MTLNYLLNKLHAKHAYSMFQDMSTLSSVSWNQIKNLFKYKKNIYSILSMGGHAQKNNI